MALVALWRGARWAWLRRALPRREREIDVDSVVVGDIAQVACLRAEVRRMRDVIGARERRRLVVLRHGKAEVGGEDFGRRLSARGRAEAAIVGAELDRMGVLFDSVVCSSSERSVEVRLGLSLR